MATVALTTAGVLEVVEWPAPNDAQTLRAAADLSAGTFIRQDSSGNWVQALATSAANMKGARLCLATVKTGQAVTGARTGTYAGFTVPQAFNADLFVSDTGTLADAAGTAGAAIGRVVPGTANLVTASQDKLVQIDLPE